MKALWLALLAAGCTSAPVGRVLVFTRTTGFRHDSIPQARAAFERLLAGEGLAADATEDESAFSAANLDRYRGVAFLLTTGEILSGEGKAAFEEWIRRGGALIGIHSAADTEYGWPFYAELLAAQFKSHPAIQRARLTVIDATHPSTAGLAQVWERTDEWYDFRQSPRGRVRVLVNLDETSYQGGGMGADHPWSWCRDLDRGRSFYTAGGHTAESWSEPLFLSHVRGGIRAALRLAPARCDPN